MHYLSSGDLAVRGFVDQEELEWLIEASSYDGNPESTFSSDRRLQRLANVALAALITSKWFLTGTIFQMHLRSTIVKNTSCLTWLLKMASSGSISLCPETTLDKLGKFEKIGTGGTSIIHKTVWKETGEIVAVKVFNESERKEAILHEVSMMSLLKHPNVLPVYARGCIHGEYAIQMFSISPFAEKSSLYHAIQENDPTFNFAIRYQVLIQIAHAIEYLHSLEIIHRDIKSLNILLTKNYQVYVGDVGSSRVQDVTMTCNTGTVSWMAPEMFSTQSYTKSIDVYSFSMLLFEVIFSKVPFTELNHFEVPGAVVKGTRPQLPFDISKPWYKLMSSMWNGKPQKRPTISEVLLSMEELHSTPFTK